VWRKWLCKVRHSLLIEMSVHHIQYSWASRQLCSDWLQFIPAVLTSPESVSNINSLHVVMTTCCGLWLLAIIFLKKIFEYYARCANKKYRRKSHIFVIITDFVTKFASFIEEGSGHICSKFCHNIWCYLKITSFGT